MPRTTHLQYVQLLETENKIKLLEPFKGAKIHHRMECLVCGHCWSATPLSKRQTYKKNRVGGCPECNNKRKIENQEVVKVRLLGELNEREIEILTPKNKLPSSWYSTQHKVKFKNHKCGHEFTASIGNVIQGGVECSICGKQKRTNVINAWSKNNSIHWKETADGWSIYKSKVTALTERNYSLFRKQINPKNLPRGKAGVEGAYHLDHIVPKRFCFDNNIPVELCADVTNLQMIGWKEKVGSRHNIKGTIPHKFLPYVTEASRFVAYIKQLKKLNPNFKEYATVCGITATLYDEQNKTAILIIPTTEQFANQKTGMNAYKRWSKSGIRSFILFEDELSDMELINNKISHYFNKSQISTVVYARKCEIREVKKTEKRDFLNTNHIQGNDASKIAYGAYYNGTLLAVMSFTSLRVALGYKASDRTQYNTMWELSRFATDVNIRVPGAASKLLKHFQRNHDWSKIISYADARWSVGNLYDVLNFQKEVHNPADYFYIIDGVRKHRWNYRKDILKTTLPNYNLELTEYQNMERAGFWRVWDCGTIRYVLNKQSSIC